MISIVCFGKNKVFVPYCNGGITVTCSVREYLAGEKGIFVGLLLQLIKPKSSVSLEFLFDLGGVMIGINEHILLYYDFNKSPIPDDSVVDQKMKLAASRDSSKLTSPSKRTPSKHCTSPVHVPVSLPSRDLKKLTIPITVDLVKENSGLGFSLASKDLILGEPGPICIQQISKDGAAMKSGKLLIGDRLLEVNGQSTTGKTQEQVVNALRAVDLGGVVSITVGRLVHNLSRKLKVQSADANFKISDEQEKEYLTLDIALNDTDNHKNEVNKNEIRNKAASDVVRRSFYRNLDEQEKEYLTLDIALNDTGSTGLGISLKGSSNTKTGKDFGIFVQSVLHGSAAWQDGRLQANDQLIKINGHSLCGMSNQVAVDIVRKSISNEGNVRGMIEMVVCRRKFDLETSRKSSDASSDMSELFLNRNKNLSSSVREDGRINFKRSGKKLQENVEPCKKKKRFLSLFKSNKTEKQEIKATEKEEYKRMLEAKKEEDFAKMKEERERIETKLKEMREKTIRRKKKRKCIKRTIRKQITNFRTSDSFFPAMKEHYEASSPRLFDTEFTLTIPPFFANYPTPHIYGSPIARKIVPISCRSPAKHSTWRPNRTKQDSSSSNESNYTASSSGLDVSEKSRYDKSPMSMPTNM